MPDLTADDLAAAGVRSVGHRRRILAAAASLRATSLRAANLRAASAAAPQTRPLAEQRIVTAMFCDLVGSTRLSTTLDPEEYRDLISRFRDLVSSTLAPYDGHLARFLGDGIVVFFGLTRTEEHTAENAVAAALEIVRRMQGLMAIGGKPAEVRLGIATGLTLVDAPQQAQRALDDTVVGEIPNLAARLQAEAAPGGILVSQATRDRLGHLFLCEDAGVLMVKGVAGGLRAWRILGHADAASRFDALRGQTPAGGFIGRGTEMALLARQTALAQGGQAPVSLIMGEAGMGKSRLAREALVAAGLDPGVVPVLQCTPYHAGTPFHPLRRLIARHLGAGPDRQAAIDAFLAAHGLTGEGAGAQLLDLLSDSSTAPSGAREATERRAKNLAFLTRLLVAMVGSAGAALVEDVQWLDPSTAELLDRAAAQPGSHVIATMRPGPVPHWCQAAGAVVLPLDRLPPADFSALIRGIAQASAPDLAVSDAQVTEIATRCDGSPVFAEELTRYMLEAQADGRRGGDQPLPATLADSLLARLDRLQDGRLLAQLGATIGNEFPVAVLVAVSNLPEAEARRGIDALVQAEVLQDGHSAFGPAVRFRHMLLQEAAYMTLLRSDRRAIHARIAAVLTGDFPDVAEAVPQVVAHQLARAGALAEAAVEWGRAGTKAARRSAYAEAISHFRQALDDLARAAPQDGPPPKDAQRTELGIRLNLVAALIASEGFNAPTVREEMPRAEALGTALQSREQLLPLLVSKWVFLGSSGQNAAAFDVARHICDLGRNGSEVERLLGLRALGTSQLFMGDFDAAMASINGFFAVYDPARHESGLNTYGTSNHAAMMALGGAEIAVLREDPQSAAIWATRAEALARASGQAHDLCNVTLFLGCILPALQSDLATVHAKAAGLRSFAQTHSLPIWEGYADIFLGTAMIARGQIDEGMAEAARGIGRSLGSAAFLSIVLMFHAEACLHAERIAEARASIDGIGPQYLTEENWLSAEVRRVKAVLSAAEGTDREQTETLLAEARAIAMSQGARLLLHKIAVSESALQLRSAVDAIPHPRDGQKR